MNDKFKVASWVGPMHPRHYVDNPPKWRMYSFERPACTLWNAIASELNKAGWTDDQIREWLQSKETRWALDGSLGEEIEALGKRYGRSIASIKAADKATGAA